MIYHSAILPHEQRDLSTPDVMPGTRGILWKGGHLFGEFP